MEKDWKKSGLRIVIGCIAMSFIMGVISSTATIVAQASEERKGEVIGNVTLESPKIFETIEYKEEKAISQQAIKIIEKNYSDVAQEDSHLNNVKEIENEDKYTLTEEDEARMNKAVSEYLKLVRYNPRLRGVGKNWWNSRWFVTNVIDVALIVIGVGATVRTAKAVMTIIRNNRRNITRVIEKQIAAKIGLGVSGILSIALNIACAASGVSVGGAIAWGLDKADGKYDGYLWA